MLLSEWFPIRIGYQSQNFCFSDMAWIWSSGKSFGMDQDCKISISIHHCQCRHLTQNVILDGTTEHFTNNDGFKVMVHAIAKYNV